MAGWQTTCTRFSNQRPLSVSVGGVDSACDATPKEEHAQSTLDPQVIAEARPEACLCQPLRVQPALSSEG